MSPYITRWLPNRQLLNGEQVVLFLRRHWFVLFTKYLFMFALALMPVIVYFIFDDVFAGFIANENARAVVILLASVYYLFIWLSVFTIFIDYYLDIWIVTNQRIIDIEQKGLFNHVVAEQTLEMVQDVSSTVKGVIPTLLDYGNVVIQSAGARTLFEFSQVSEPGIVGQTISKLIDDYRDQHTHITKQ